MNAKQSIVLLLILVLVCCALSLPVGADQTPEFRYEITVDGEDAVELDVGDVITVTLHLIRTDEDAPFTMYAMQSELRYDGSFFELVEGSVHLREGVQSSDIAREGDFRELYMNYLSLSGGEEWQARTYIGSFQLRVIGTQGVSTITNRDYSISAPGQDAGYPGSSNQLTVILDSACLVRFESNGGTQIDAQAVVFGEKVTRPPDPEREGMRFAGWYTDIFLTEAWDFDTDTVQGNMRLYAKWEQIDTSTETETTVEADPTETESERESAQNHQPPQRQECLFCGNMTENALCTRCTVVVMVTLCVLAVLIFALVIWFYFRLYGKSRT